MEDGDSLRRCVAAAEPDDGVGAVVLLKPLGVGHGPEQPFGVVLPLLPGDAREMVVLRRFDVLAAAACVEVRQHAGPFVLPCRRSLARRGVVHPCEDDCRCREQQQNQ